MSKFNERLDEILEGIANEYSAGSYYEHSPAITVDEASEAIRTLIKEANQ